MIRCDIELIDATGIHRRWFVAEQPSTTAPLLTFESVIETFARQLNAEIGVLLLQYPNGQILGVDVHRTEGL